MEIKTRGQHKNSRERRIAEQEKLIQALEQRSHELSERVKELTCLYGISTLVEKPGVSLEDVLRGTADLLPSAWRYSDAACARLILEGRSLQTGNFRETQWRQSSDIKVHGERAGFVDVCYLEEKPERDEGPFLIDERKLIDAVAARVGRIVERYRAEEAAREAYRRETRFRQDLEAEIEKRSEFLKILVHELKTPLTAVMASSGALVANVTDKTCSDFARSIERGAVRLNDRINELTDLARGELGMLRLELEPVDLVPVLRETAEEVAPMASGNRQRLVVDLPGRLPTVLADKDRLRQAVMNLLHNALKFTSTGGEIRLGARQRKHELFVYVRDSGLGIRKSDQERLFDPYQQLIASDERYHPMGIGLSLSKTLVELHGGRIWFASQKGRGSTFGFYVPLATSNHTHCS